MVSSALSCKGGLESAGRLKGCESAGRSSRCSRDMRLMQVRKSLGFDTQVLISAQSSGMTRMVHRLVHIRSLFRLIELTMVHVISV